MVRRRRSKTSRKRTKKRVKKTQTNLKTELRQRRSSLRHHGYIIRTWKVCGLLNLLFFVVWENEVLDCLNSWLDVLLRNNLINQRPFHLLLPVFRRKEPAELRPAAQKPLVLRCRPHHLMGAADGERQTNKTEVCCYRNRNSQVCFISSLFVLFKSIMTLEFDSITNVYWHQLATVANRCSLLSDRFSWNSGEKIWS